jgi:hypothetical protein
MTYGRLLVVGLLAFALALPGLSQENDRPHARAVRVTASQTPFGDAAAVFAFVYFGDHIVHYGDGGDESARLYGSRNIGFKFSVVSIACFHLWTWGGTFCVFEPTFANNRLGEKYAPISHAEAARLLRKTESELTTPFWYRFPPGMLILAASVLFGLIYGLVRRAKLRTGQVGQAGR